MCILGICLMFNTSWNILHWIIWLPVGAITWTLLEYILHRYMFHLISRTRWINEMVFYVHGVHHQYAITTNYVPFLQNVLFYGSGLVVVYLLMGSAAMVFYIGFILAVMFQVYIHNLVHEGDSGYFKKLQRHHQYHHHDPTVNFGISTTFWDRIFRSLR